MRYPYIVNAQINLNTIKELWDTPDCAYNDPDSEGTAERELAMLQQGTSKYSAYFTDFQRIMAELQVDPSAKKATLRQGMAGNLKDLILSYECPDDWVSYIRLLQRLNSKLRLREAEKKKETTNTPSKATPSMSSPATSSSTTHITSNLTYLGLAPWIPRQPGNSLNGSASIRNAEVEASAPTAEHPAISELPPCTVSAVRW